jgi:hypothetical protein
MRTIHKQVICQCTDAYGEHVLQMPDDQLILNVGIQYDEIVVWYATDTDNTSKHQWKFFVGWTGQDLPVDPTEYRILGTLQDRKGLVHHVFGQ